MFVLPYADDIVLLILRLFIGVFFILARFRYFYDPSRPEDKWFNHARVDHLAWKLGYCHFPAAKYIAPLVATVEIGAAAFLIIGLITPIAAFGLLVILLGATHCTAMEKVAKQEPVDRIDWWSCYLWTVEPIYIGIAVALIVAGAGTISLDALIW